MQAHLGPMLGQFSVIWGCLGLYWGYVVFLDCHGPMLAHQGAILGLCWALLGLCWHIMAQSWGYVGTYIGPTLSHLGSVLAKPAPSWNCVNARTNKTSPKTRLEARFSRYLWCFLHISALRPHTSKTTKTAKFGSRAGKTRFLHQLDSF